jgi:hypothetical protein
MKIYLLIYCITNNYYKIFLFYNKMAEYIGKQINSSSEKDDEIVLAEIVVTQTVLAEIVPTETVLAETVLAKKVVTKKASLCELNKKRIPIRILQHLNVLYEFMEGKKITVILSNGIIDYGWEITPACYQYFVKNPNLGNSWCFEVKKDNLTKVIKLIDLKMSINKKKS